MKIIDKQQRTLEKDSGRWVVWGIAEDDGRKFAYLIDKQTGKHYVEEVVNRYNLNTNMIDLELRWIDDNKLHADLVDFFHRNVHQEAIIKANMQAINNLGRQ